MTEKYSLKFINPDGCAQLFVNGFLVLAEEDLGPTVSRGTPFMRKGENFFQIIPVKKVGHASLIVQDMSLGDPNTAPVLLALSLEPEMPRQGKVIVNENMIRFKWLLATQIETIDFETRAIYSLLKNLSQAMENVSESELTRLLSDKHKEIGMSVGLSTSEMNEGLSSGLSALKRQFDFRVDLAPFEDFLPLLSSDGRIINTRRKSGGHAMRIIDGRMNPGFSVSLAKVGGIWTILR